ALARQYSQDPTTNLLGGDLGYFVKGQMIPEIDQVAFSLPKGSLSQPLNTQFGWHLVRVEDRRTRALPKFEDLREGLAALLVQRRAREVVTGLREKSKIEIADPALK